jgi:hypothetical protein
VYWQLYNPCSNIYHCERLANHAAKGLERFHSGVLSSRILRSRIAFSLRPILGYSRQRWINPKVWISVAISLVLGGWAAQVRTSFYAEEVSVELVELKRFPLQREIVIRPRNGDRETKVSDIITLGQPFNLSKVKILKMRGNLTIWVNVVS